MRPNLFRIPPAFRQVSDVVPDLIRKWKKDRRNCKPAGSCLRNYPHISACSGYLQRFPYGTPGRNLWGRSGPCFCNGELHIQKEYRKRKQQEEKARKCCQTFSGLPYSNGGIHGAVSDTPPRLLEEIYGKPFQAAIQESDLLGIMPCYCTVNGGTGICILWTSDKAS